MRKKRLMNLQMFADDPTPPNPEPSNPTPPNPDPNNPIDYDRLEQILHGKQTATEESVLRGYFKQQGLSKEEAEKAIDDFKEKKKQNDPNNKIKDLEAKLAQYENEKILSEKNVLKQDYDYVSFKAGKIAEEKNISFEKAVSLFLKDNPKFSEPSRGYRVTTGVPSGRSENANTKHESINSMIREAFGR